MVQVCYGLAQLVLMNVARKHEYGVEVKECDVGCTYIHIYIFEGENKECGASSAASIKARNARFDERSAKL